MTRYTCSFVLSSDGEKDPPLRCRIRWDGCRSRLTFMVGYRINVERWDKKAQRCIVGSFHGPHRVPALVINREIQRYVDACDAVFAMIGEEWPSMETVRSSMRVELGLDESKEITVRNALDEFVQTESVRGSWSDTTVYKFRALDNHLTVWNEAPLWEDFRTDGLSAFLLSMQQEGLSNVTCEKMLRFLKWFLQWAVIRHYTDIRDFADFKPKILYTQKRVIFLEWDELMAMWDWEAPKARPFLALTRDIFCFCAFSGLRYSDALALRWADVEKDCFRITTKKTADSLTIELNKWTNEILGRYVDVSVPDDYVFPRASNQAMNRALKDICKGLKFITPIRVTTYSGATRTDEVKQKWELIGTHCARRTFICNALMMGIAPNVVMQWTGHSDYSAMKPYIAITDEARVKAMGQFDGLSRTQKTESK